MITTQTKRIEFIDALKGFAMFFVVWGHSMQYLTNDDFFDHPVFEFIYSFHMALFFMVSGFFFKSSLKLNSREFLRKKIIQLLLPCFAWAFVFYFLNLLIDVIKGKEHILTNWFEEIKLMIGLGWNSLWFLRELFISFFIVYFSFKILKNKWLSFLLSIGFVLVAPYCEMQRFFLPIFWAGIFLKDNYQFVFKRLKWIGVASGVIFGICLLFWKGRYTIYVAGFPGLFNFSSFHFDLTNIDISLFRSVIGLMGSLFWFTLFVFIYKKNTFFHILEKIGIQTLAIYVLQTFIMNYLFEKIVKKMIDFSAMNIWIFDLIVTPVIAVLTLWVCMIIIKWINKNKYLGLLLFGKN